MSSLGRSEGAFGPSKLPRGAIHYPYLAAVERQTLDVARETLREVSGGVAEFEPEVRYRTFAVPGVRFTAVLRAQAFVDQFLLKHEFIRRLHRRYGDEGIELKKG
jgi:hypothetical protein